MHSFIELAWLESALKSGEKKSYEVAEEAEDTISGKILAFFKVT